MVAFSRRTHTANVLHELESRLADHFTSFVVSGGIHGTSTNMVSPAFSTKAYINGVYLDHPSTSIDYASLGMGPSDTAWVILSTDPSLTAISGTNFSRVPGTDYFVDHISTTQPALPANSVWLMKVATSGGAITAVTDLRPLSRVSIPSSTKASLPTPSPETAGQLFRVTDDVRGLWMDQGTQWFSLSGEIVNVREFGAKGDGITDDTAAIQNAINTAASFHGIVYLPPGTYLIKSPLVITGSTAPIYIVGSGCGDANGALVASEIVADSSDAFHILGVVSGLYFSNFAIRSIPPNGGHLIHIGADGLVFSISESTFFNMLLVQGNANKSIVRAVEPLGVNCGFFGVKFILGRYFYAQNTVPAFDIKCETINHLHFSNFRITGSQSSSAEAIRLETTNSVGQILCVSVSDITVEVAGGGFINILGGAACFLSNVGVFDMTAAPANPMIALRRSGAGTASFSNTLVGVWSNVGAAGKPDLYVDVGDGIGSVTVINSWLGVVEQAANGGLALINTRVSSVTGTYLSLGTGRLSFNTGGGAAASYDIISGVPGAFDGYLRILRNGSFSAGINDANNFIFGGTETAPNAMVSAAGKFITLTSGFEGARIADPGPVPDRGTIYFRDNGAGKMQLVVQFPTGTPVVLATEA